MSSRLNGTLVFLLQKDLCKYVKSVGPYNLCKPL